ncbi:MAG: hypothetical protein ABSH52_22400, partial [Terriglobia bacterium]
MKDWSELEKQAACQVAALMAGAARTAPKTRGIDNIQVVAIDDESTRQALVKKMQEIARAENRPGFERDANNVAASPAIVVIGVQSNPAELNCGFCGNPTCDELRAKDGICSFNPTSAVQRIFWAVPESNAFVCSARSLSGLNSDEYTQIYSL